MPTHDGARGWAAIALPVFAGLAILLAFHQGWACLCGGGGALVALYFLLSWHNQRERQDLQARRSKLTRKPKETHGRR